MAGSDFLFSIGVDAAQADAAVQEFVKRSQAAINSIQKVQFASNAGAKQAIENQTRLLRLSEQRLAMEEKIAAAQSRNKTSALGGGAQGGGMTDISAVATRNAAAIGKQKDALDFLNRIMGNTVFKFVEYELIMKAFNGAAREVFNSLNEASNVQMEQVLQRLYNKTIDVNMALKDSIIIAKQWGSDITDVQQVIGLWTKQTAQMHDATGKLVDSQTALAAAAKLAAESEQFHRASGIDSLEVYTKSISMWHELGLSLGEIPGLYDKIAFAATKIARPLKAQPGTGGSEEGIKDIFDAVAESGATLKAQGMDEATIIATVAQQVENLGQQGTKAGSVISTMFASLNQGGKPLQTWVNLLGGPGAFKDADTFMEAAIQHVQDLKQANADGALHVKPYTLNTWRAFINTLEEVKQRADDIRQHSQGFLQIISEAQMNTYNGQVARLGASFQELNLALGTQLLPTATRFISFLSGSLLPLLAHNSGAVTGFAQTIIGLGAAYLLMLGVTKGWSAFQGFRAEASSASLVAEEFGAAQLSTIPGMAEATAQMQREQAALAMLKEQLSVVEWQTGGLAKQCAALGIAETDLALITEQRLPGAFTAAGAAMKGFMGSIMATMGPLIAIYGIMQLVSSGFAAFDQRGNMLNSLNENLLGKGTWQGRAESIPNIWGHAQAGYSALFGRDKLATQQFNNLAKGDPQLERLYTEFKASKSTAHQDALREQILLQAGQDFDQKHFKNVPGYGNIDHIPKWLQDEMNHAMGGTPSGITMPGDLSKGKGPHLATEQQIAAEGVNKTKADAMAEISKWRDIGNAASAYIKVIGEVAKANGYTQETVNKLSAAFKVENDAIAAGESATKKEITRLEGQQKSLEGLISKHGGHLDPITGQISGGDRTSAIYAEGKAWRMAQEAIEKATGALSGYEEKKQKLQADEAAVDEAQAWASMGAAMPKTIGAVAAKTPLSFIGGSVNVTSGTNPMSSPEAFKTFMSSLDDNLSKASTTIGKLQTAQNQVNTLKQLGEAIYQLYQKTNNPTEAAVLVDVLLRINDAGKKAKAGIVESDKSVADFNRNLADLNKSITDKNAQDMGKLLGLSPEAISAQQTLIDGFQTISDDMDKIQQYITTEAGSYANLTQSQKTMVQSAVQQLQLQQQLIPLLQQQQQIQSSIAYQATQETLQKAGEYQIQQAIDRLMGNDNNMRTRSQQYDAAKNGTWMSPMQSVFKDYLTNTVTQWWSNTVKQFTNAMFGDQAAQARQLEQTMMKQNRDGLTQILQQTKTDVVNKLFQFETLFAKDVGKLSSSLPTTNGATGGYGSNQQQGTGTPGGGQNPGSGSQGTESNPTVITTVGDGGQGLFSGTTSQGNMATAVAAGLDSSTLLKNVSDGSDQMNQTSSDAADNVSNLLQSASPATGSSSNGLLSGLLGPLSQIPGLSKYLSSNGSWLNGLSNAIGGGAGMGEMFGGPGSTNSTWGALGGAVGFGAGTALGGPVGGQVGGMIGGLLGGLFGHSVNPLNEPDVYDTMNYGKFVANVNGAPGTFNGTVIAPDPQYDIADGGIPLDKQMATWAQANQTNPIAKQINALGPRLDIASEYQGVFTLGSGKTISVTAYEQLVQQFQAAAGNTSNRPIVSVNSYGGGSAANAYGTPGMDSSTFLAEEASWAQGQGGGSYNTAPGPLQTGGGGSSSGPDVGGGTGLYSQSAIPSVPMPTATPGYGGASRSVASGRGVSITSLVLALTTPVYLDGKLITQIVNSYNAQQRSNAGSVGHTPYQ